MPAGFPPKKNSFLKPRRIQIPKQKKKYQTEVTSVALFLGFLFSFLFLQQRCQRRARPKQADFNDCQCTNTKNRNVRGRRSSFTSHNEPKKNNKMTRSMYCKIIIIYQKKENKQEGEKEIIFIFLLPSCFEHFLFSNVDNLIFFDEMAKS